MLLLTLRREDFAPVGKVGVMGVPGRLDSSVGAAAGAVPLGRAAGLFCAVPTLTPFLDAGLALGP